MSALEQRDLARDGEAAAPREVRLEDVDVAALDERRNGPNVSSASPAAIRTRAPEAAGIAVESSGCSASSNQ